MFIASEEFERWNNINLKYLTDIERTVRFFYLQRLSFYDEVDKRSFGVNIRIPKRDDNEIKASRLERLLFNLYK